MYSFSTLFLNLVDIFDKAVYNVTALSVKTEDSKCGFKLDSSDNYYKLYAITDSVSAKRIATSLNLCDSQITRLAIQGLCIAIIYQARNDNRSYISVKMHKFDEVQNVNCLSARGYHKTGIARSCIIYENDFDIRISSKNSKAMFPVSMSDLMYLFGGSYTNISYKAVCELFKYYKEYYLESGREDLANQINILMKETAENSDAQSWENWDRYTRLYQWVLSKDVDMYCRTLGIDQPIPNAGKMPIAMLTLVCRAAKLLRPEARPDFYKYVEENKERIKMYCDQFGKRGHEPLITDWISHHMEDYLDRGMTLRSNHYVSYMKALRLPIPVIKSNDMLERELKTAIYQYTQKYRKEIERKFKILNTHPQVLCLDKLLDGYSDEDVEIRRVKSFEEFQMACEEYLVNPDVAQYSITDLYYVVRNKIHGSLFLYAIRMDAGGVIWRFTDVELIRSMHSSYRNREPNTRIIKNAYRKVNKLYGQKIKDL